MEVEYVLVDLVDRDRERTYQQSVRDLYRTQEFQYESHFVVQEEAKYVNSKFSFYLFQKTIVRFSYSYELTIAKS